MIERKRTAALALKSGATQEAAGAAVGRKPRTLRDWLRDDPEFAALATPDAAVVEDDLTDLTPRAVLEHLLHDPRPEIRLRASDILLKLDAPGAPGADAAPQALNVFFGPGCDSGNPCECVDCQAKREAALVAYAQEARPDYIHATRKELAPA